MFIYTRIELGENAVDVHVGSTDPNTDDPTLDGVRTWVRVNDGQWKMTKSVNYNFPKIKMTLQNVKTVKQLTTAINKFTN